MATWKDIKLATLQKMFSADGNTIPNDSSTRDYIASMPTAANEGLQMLATAGKFVIKSIDIAHNPVSNLLSDGDKIKKTEGGTLTFEAEGAKSLYLEYYGVCTINIKVGETDYFNGNLTSKSGYSSFKKLITNANNEKVVVTLVSTYPLATKNVALYQATFESEDEIQSYAEKIRYNLKALASDFYMLSDDPIVFEGDATSYRYIQSNDYLQEGNTVLVLDRNICGNFKIYYKAYPQAITSETTDDTVLEVDPEVIALLPLYMASQLYKEDDNGIATSYRNEFETAFGRLRDTKSTPSAETFTSESGW